MTDAELKKLLEEGVGGKNRELDTSRLERDLEIMISHAVDLTGQRFTIRTLESGLGKFEIFCSEIVRGETAVKVVMHDGKPRLLTFSEKVEASHVVGDYEVVEKWRRYEYLNNLIVPTTTRKVIQGTLQRGEGPKPGAKREVKEECDTDVKESELFRIPEPLVKEPLSDRRRRESSVYPGVLRSELRWKFRFVRQRREWDFKETPPDNGVVVFFAFEPRVTDDVLAA